MTNNRNLLENVDYAEGESQSVTNFLEIECNKCGNKIKFKLAIGDIKNVEEYIEHLQAEIEKKDKIIDKLIDALMSHDEHFNYCDKKLHKKHKDSCQECLKEYFINKVEKESKDELKNRTKSR